MLITVFGGTGFLGCRIVEALATAGHRVRVAARRPNRAVARAPDANLDREPVDVRVEAEVAAALLGADASVNAVSLYVEQHDASFHAIHVEAAERIARLAREHGVRRHVHVSGIGADTASPSRYVRSRAHGEAAVKKAFPSAILLRPSAMVSRSEGLLATLKALTHLPLVPLFGRGNVRLQPVHVSDVAAAVDSVLRQSVEGIFELGGADVIPYRELVEAVLAMQGRRRPLVPVPMPVWHVVAFAAGILPSPPITRDQLELLSRDNVVAEGARGFGALGIEPRGVLNVLRSRSAQAE